jgi:ABC-type Fe3+ transport system permease subunit
LKQNRRILLPAIIIMLISLLLVLYYYYTLPARPTGPHPGVHPHPDKERGFDFTLFGNIAIACGAVSYWWFLFKKMLTSPSKPLKKIAKRIYSIHTYMGWAALVLVIIHGAYYLITDLQNTKLFTGIAAFLLLLALAMYGWLYRRVRNKFMRTSHFILGNAWLVALLVHAGGFFIFMVVITVLLWCVIRFMDSSARKTQAQ